MLFISSQIRSYFAAHPIATLWTVPEVTLDSDHPVHEELARLLECIPDDLVKKRRQNPSFKFYNPDSDRAARAEIFRDELDKQLASLLYHHLVSDSPRSLPYIHEDLICLEIDKNFLTPIESIGPNRYFSTSHEYYLCRSGPVINSMAWVNDILSRVIDHSQTGVRIRLDPLLRQPLPGRAPMQYKMWVYGTTLSWNEIESLQEDQHGRWMPHPLTTTARFTDFLWSPRDAEIHFTCEEIPSQEQLTVRGSRYLHAIYSPAQRCFIHLDGAVRFYSESDYAKRVEIHLRNAGKIGKRVKLFQVDGGVPEEHWSALTNAFFYGNQDVWNYLAPSERYRIPPVSSVS